MIMMAEPSERLLSYHDTTVRYLPTTFGQRRYFSQKFWKLLNIVVSDGEGRIMMLENLMVAGSDADQRVVSVPNIVKFWSLVGICWFSPQESSFQWL